MPIHFANDIAPQQFDGSGEHFIIWLLWVIREVVGGDGLYKSACVSCQLLQLGVKDLSV